MAKRVTMGGKWTKRERPVIAKAGLEYTDSTDCLRMDLNTNLFGPNPAIRRFLTSGDFETHHYPSVDSVDLRTVLGKEWNVDPAYVITGNGVDDIINLVVRAFTKRGDKIAYPSPSFFMYDFFARTYGCNSLNVPLRSGFQLDVPGLLKKKAHLTFIASPNNPTGNRFRTSDIVELLEGSEGIIAVDEAYIEYSGGSFVRRLSKYPNLVVFRTFSKAYAIAGMRVGVAVSKGGSEKLASVRPPFNLNIVSEAAALAALRNRAWLKKVVSTISSERKRMAKALRKLGFKVHPSDANFLLCKSPNHSTLICQRLIKKGIMIKDFGSVPTLKDHVRITIGRKKHNDRLLRCLGRIL